MHGGRSVGENSEAYVGFDTSKTKHAVAIADGGRGGEVRFVGDVAGSPARVERLIRKLAERYGKLHFCYEAGPTGYGLYRQIKESGYDCTAVEQRAEASDRRGGVCAWRRGAGRGTPSRRNIEIDLPLAAGFASGCQWLCSGGDGPIQRWHGRGAADAGDRDRICGQCPRPDPGGNIASCGGRRRCGIGRTVIPVPAGVRVWLAVGHTDMRRGMNSLAIQVQQGLGRDPHAGDLYVFRGKRGHLIKLLWHDGIGMSLDAKRLERGRFIWPSPAAGTVADYRSAAGLYA